MRVKGLVGRQNVPVLVDRGSTHNFIDVKTAKKLGVELKECVHCKLMWLMVMI